MKICYSCMREVNEDFIFCPYCSAQLNGQEYPIHHLKPGTRLYGKYIVGKALGEGGFGITYVGLDEILQRKVAIKEYYPNGVVTRLDSQTLERSVTAGRTGYYDEGLSRFLDEAKALARFASEPGIVMVHDYFEENNTGYIVMEYLEGETLKAYLKRVGLLKPEDAISLLRPVMNSLAVIHRGGLIHRDISPDNIILTQRGIKLLDFGAARGFEQEGNKSKSVLLKEGYAPEEQYRKRGEQGPWTDVYALCGTIYKCITGRTPDEALERAYMDELKRPSELGISISEEIESAIMHGLSVYAKDRIQNVDQLLAEIESSGAESYAYSPNPTPPVLDENQQKQDDDLTTHTVWLLGEVPTQAESIAETQIQDDTDEESPTEFDNLIPVASGEQKKKRIMPVLLSIMSIISVALMAGISWYFIVKLPPVGELIPRFLLPAPGVILLVFNALYLVPQRKKPLKYTLLTIEILAAVVFGYPVRTCLLVYIFVSFVIYHKINVRYGKMIKPLRCPRYNIWTAVLMQAIAVTTAKTCFIFGHKEYIVPFVLVVELFAAGILVTRRISEIQFWGLLNAVLMFWILERAQHYVFAQNDFGLYKLQYINLVLICSGLIVFFVYSMIKELLELEGYGSRKERLFDSNKKMRKSFVWSLALIGAYPLATSLIVALRLGVSKSFYYNDSPYFYVILRNKMVEVAAPLLIPGVAIFIAVNIIFWIEQIKIWRTQKNTDINL